MLKRKTFLFIGTSAELIKLIPIIREFNSRKTKFIIIASGQNDIRFDEFASELRNIEISYAVTPKKKDSSLLLFSIWAFRTFISLLVGMKIRFKGLNKSNSYFIVHGDTVSSLMGALVASLYGLKLVHIESGLRSSNFLEPFPEEISRYVISKLADIHFCPNEWAINNLKHEKGDKVNTKQNTLIETFWSVMKSKSHYSLLTELRKQKQQYFILVIHRQEHVLFQKNKTTEIVKFILTLIPKQIQCIFLVHDLSVDFIHALGVVIPHDEARRMIRIERLPYGDFMHLLSGSEFMITDGGSNQEEMYYMGKPCLLLRNYTERIEGLNRNVILSKNNKGIIKDFIHNYRQYNSNPIKIDKSPAVIIVDYLNEK